VHHGLLRNSLACILPAGLTVGVIAQLCTLRLGLEPAYAAKAVVVFAAGAAMVLIGLPRHHPFGAFGPANQVTVGRGMLVALLAGLIGERTDTGAPALAVILATSVAVLDGTDGWLARRTGMSSAFGARFDMETDAALIMVLALLTWLSGKAGPWVLASGLLRYLFVVCGALLPWLRRPLPPSERRKTVAVVQMVTLIVALAPVIPVPVSGAVALLGLAALTLSFLLDIVWLVQNASQVHPSVSPQ